MTRQAKTFEMEDRTPWAKLGKYLAGECSSEEKREIVEWIQADPSREKLAKQVRLIWDVAGESRAERSEDLLDVDAEWEELQAEIDRSSGSSSSLSSAPGKRPVQENSGSERSRQISKRATASQSSLSRGLTLMAVVALAVLAGALFWKSSSLISEQTPFEREVTTERGERATLRLSDGTKMKLNAESQLRFPDSFHRQDSRIVHLSGEAYFDVQDDSTKPFVVRADGASVDVHGTSFNVRARSGEKEVQVAVEKGGVALRVQGEGSTENREVRLGPGEVGRALGESTLVATDEIDLKAHIGWADGLLAFEDASLPEVATRLGRWYNLDFVIQDSSLQSMRLTANLKSGSPEEVLNVIAASLGIQYRIDQGTVYLSLKNDRGG